MGFKNGGYAKVWAVEDKGNYSVVELSSSKKNKETGEYETDFSNKFVRFIGTAHKEAGKLGRNDSIKLGDIEVTNKYDKTKNTTYTNYMVYSFEKSEGNGGNTNNKAKDTKPAKGEFMNIPDGIDEELPFN
jgi:hypothetical protein